MSCSAMRGASEAAMQAPRRRTWLPDFRQNWLPEAYCLSVTASPEGC